MTWLLRLLLLLVVFVVLLPLLPILLVGGALARLWRTYDGWRCRRGFEMRFRPEGKKAVLVYSDSPHWKERFESELLPKIRNQVVVLNWSERSSDFWSARPLEVRIFKHWGGTREFNPLAIVFPEGGSVEVIRFWQAYKDYKHGKPRLLKVQEQRLFDALGVPTKERPEVATLQADR